MSTTNQRSLIVTACIFIAIFFVVDRFFNPFDDSDTPPKRSGLIIYTDALTGCQYVGRLFGGVTPRANADGKQVCRRGE